MVDITKKLATTKARPEQTKQFLAYVNDARDSEAKKEKRPVASNTDADLYSLFVKFFNLGLIIDGVNVVIAGKKLAMVTYHGYKNKVLQTYPEATFDVQLVREGDEFKVRKESGKVHYSHEFGNPFGETEIKGAYCIIKLKGAEYFEALGPKDFAAMKKVSKQSYLWQQWASEFWLKSVIKRACKRHFNDVVAELDKVDNDDFGLAKVVKADPDKKAKIIAVAKDTYGDSCS